ncbi:MAG: AAA family ATPase [Thermoplasmatales archaeon]|jgi:adenylate kinase|nr:AAA family ATPase [Candidatus Thermoplasmatota archaeon]MCL6002850.1 AAA family ATPase [Candidatus Thermoplasmatota archaeon]MDA8054288.1 AAA family ATPase [Thermoplasmatales archaeon]
MICITGTPGVGKTTVMKELKKRGYAVLEFDSLIDGCVLEEENGEKIVDEECLKDIRGEGIYFGHLSHYALCDLVVVLRCHLKELEVRLRKRDYSRSKIIDNIESEAIDLIGFEAEKIHPGKTYEIMNSKVEETADFIENVIKGRYPTRMKIDIMEEILDWY